MSTPSFRHIGITVSDLERSMRFYCRALGYRLVRERRGQSGDYISELVGLEDAEVDIVLLEAPDGSKLELLQYRSHASAPGADASASEPGRPHFALTVSGLGGIYDRRSKLDITFKSAPLESPDDPVLVAYCHDPDGVIIELVELLGVQR
ncbi:MAG: hypothetical protein HOO19_14025 [Rhodospirillaceae bacterium]|jgi:catechol 2,3-dioxygenase-like lactoylglutathione lyase family enzyme|nr:hypothetical protein [Rhodospirillaceae bacterium]MBT3887163.1 hypothetical protein [Rhodospirillaceae bacterium]MBT4115519.1 hypothetical protein [Rhodospirillaceae bacterium]MBT4673530.1 hypothetical protein [Rhodospirillaceae bacterium]MBT4721707.1 hypothetical protein [Rhodospirillaceae bacterium]